MKIIPKTLKFLRERLNMSQADLAQATEGKERVSLSTIKRIESSKLGAVDSQNRIVKKLAEVLEVKPAVLSKEECDVPALKDDQDTLFFQTLKTRISESTAKSLIMIEHIYGVSINNQVRMAPMLIALLAEKSLLRRQEMLGEMQTAIDTLTGRKDHLSFGNQARRLDDAIQAESDSIKNRDIFGHNISDESFVEGYKSSERNPFADYLNEFATEVKSEIKTDEIEIVPNEIGEARIPEYNIGQSKLSEISGDDKWANYALVHRYVRISDIPKKLMKDDARDERVKWLTEQIPAAARKKHEKQHVNFRDDLFGKDFTLEKGVFQND